MVTSANQQAKYYSTKWGTAYRYTARRVPLGAGLHTKAAAPWEGLFSDRNDVSSSCVVDGVHLRADPSYPGTRRCIVIKLLASLLRGNGAAAAAAAQHSARKTMPTGCGLLVTLPRKKTVEWYFMAGRTRGARGNMRAHVAGPSPVLPCI